MAQRSLNLCQSMLDKKKESKDNNTYSIIEKSDSEWNTYNLNCRNTLYEMKLNHLEYE